MFSYSQSIGRPGTSLPTLYYLSNVYALKLLVPTSTNTKKLIISHWCYFQFELILPHGTMVLKCTPNRRNAGLEPGLDNIFIKFHADDIYINS